jgi:uncharacterized membrane protein
MTTRTSTLTRALAAIAATTVAAFALVASASAAPPPASAGNVFHGFLAEDGVVTAIDHPDAPAVPDGGTSTLGINDSGEIVGVYGDQVNGAHLFVRDRRERFATIADPYPGAAVTEPVDINNRREITGFYYRTGADLEQGISHGFLRSPNGRVTRIDYPGAVLTRPFRSNDRGQIVGAYADESTLHGFVWDRKRGFETVEVPGSVFTHLTGINNRGQMVGFYLDADGAYHGLLRERSGAITPLDAPGAAPTLGGTQPVGINERGQIVGVAYDNRGGGRGFLYERGTFTPIDAPNAATYTRPLDINSRGQIVGDYDTRQPARESSSGGDSAARLAAPALSDPLGLELMGLPAGD